MNKKFLEKMLVQPSPSGAEEEMQNLLKDELKKYVDQFQTDPSGNLIAVINPKAEFKVLIAAHCDEISFIVRHIDDSGFVYVAASGGISPKVALGHRVRILGYKEVVNGVVAVPPEHKGGAKDGVKVTDLVIDCGAKDKKSISDKVRVGDYVIYSYNYDYLLDSNIAARALDNRSGGFIISEVAKKLSKKRPSVGVYLASTANEETNMGGAYFAASRIKPNIGIACDVTFATDDTSSSATKDGVVKLGLGPVLSHGAPISKKVNSLIENAAQKSKISIQHELTPRMTGTDADKIRLSGDGVPVALISLPLRYMHSPSEVVNLKDIQSEIDLITEFILSLTGDEKLNYIEL